MEKSCLDCLYSNYTESTLLLNKWFGDQCMKCEHPNSPYYDEIVNDKKICRLFINEKEYFKNRDREEKIKELKTKSKFKKK
jgi:alpha-D-ribose 1-methylphosphonate 5-phosphate C-P lyase